MAKLTNTRGGQANEAGSVYRRGVAAIIVAHGLRGKGIAALGIPEAGPHPVSIAFETKDAVDDIEVILSDGSRVLIQAKRSYGADATFTSAVGQLVAMLDQMTNSDRLVVVSATAKGDVKQLPEALRLRRAGGVLTTDHEKALNALAKAAGLDRASGRFDELCAIAYAWQVSAEGPHDLGYQIGALLLEGTVVAPGHGHAALDVLLSRLHGEAGAASRSHLATWWTWLDDARVPLIGSASGVAAQRLTAERDALSAYRRCLAECKDVVDLFLLSEHAPAVTIPNLLSTVRVSRSSQSETGFELADMLRRHQQLVLEGLPGSGKSTAVSQLAAEFAADDTAPLPIVVKLSRACADLSDSHDVILELLVADAVRRAPAGDRAILAEMLTRELSSGFAVLICDGLDECHTRASAVADGLARINKRLGPNAGMIVTTRPSAAHPARRLGMRQLSLLTPARNTDVQQRILDAVMDDPEVDEETRSLRRLELERVQREHPDIVGVPLLGNLVALLVGSGRDTTDGRNVADLVEAAVRQALSRWERQRGGEIFEAAGIPSLLTVDMLWDGFIAIGHLVAEHERLPARGEAVARVAQMFGESWNKSGREGAVLAGHVVGFWDATISVFVEDQDGMIAPRSRVFADLADAIWVSTTSPEVKQQWVTDVVNDETRYNNFLLAAMKDPSVPELAMTVVQQPEARRLLVEWLCAAASRLPLSDTTLEAMLDTLITEAHAVGDWIPVARPPTGTDLAWSPDQQRQKDGLAWPFVRRAASLPVPSRLRGARDALIAEVGEDPERAYTAAALAATTDARYDARPLTDGEIDCLASLLQLPLPAGEDDPLVETARNEYTIKPLEPMISGRPEAVLQAAQLVDQLPVGSAEAIARISTRTPGSYAVDIEVELARHGVIGPLREQFTKFTVPSSLTDPSPLARCLSEVATPAKATPGDIWWCRESFRLYDLMAVGGTVAVELQLAGEEPHRSTLKRLARLYCDINQFDAAMVAAQVGGIAQQGDSALKHFEWTAIAFASDKSRTRSLTAVDDESREVLTPALISPCRWLGELAFFAIVHVTDATLSEDLINRLGTVHPWGRYWTTLAACKVSAEPVATAARLMTADTLTRVAVAKFLRATDDGSQRVRELLSKLRSDEDLLVREAATSEGPIPDGSTKWTCSWCIQVNDAAVTACAHCERGSRPHIEVS